jgi:hypothetical protein
MFAEEKPALLPLPVEPFHYYQYGDRTVHLDGCVEVEAAYYGAPPGWIGRRVQVQWDPRQVRLMNPQTGQLLREHLRQVRGGHRIQDEDRPKYTPLGTLKLLCRVAPFNGLDGIIAGPGALVGDNTAFQNGGSGILARCQSLVEGNAALSNAGGNLSTSGSGCVLVNNVAP